MTTYDRGDPRDRCNKWLTDRPRLDPHYLAMSDLAVATLVTQGKVTPESFWHGVVAALDIIAVIAADASTVRTDPVPSDEEMHALSADLYHRITYFLRCFLNDTMALPEVNQILWEQRSQRSQRSGDGGA